MSNGLNGLPVGTDRADGVNNALGSGNPAGAILITSHAGIGTTQLEELPDSPTIERAEHGTVTHTFRTTWADALTRLRTLWRGRPVTDSSGDSYTILSSAVQHQTGDLATLHVVMESSSYDLPPDDFRCTPQDLAESILRHPRYMVALEPDSAADALVNQHVIRRLQDYMANTNSQMRNAIQKEMVESQDYYGDGDITAPVLNTSEGAVNALLPGTKFAKAAAYEIITKYWYNIETPYLAGFEVVWSKWSMRPPYQHPGGVVQAPWECSPQIPEGFYMATDTKTMWDGMPFYNPTGYSTTGDTSGALMMSWLRLADSVEFSRTMFRTERKWLGAPFGYWDLDLFTKNLRPEEPEDYDTDGAITNIV